MRKFSRWRRWVGSAALVAGASGLGGCTRPLFMTPETQHIASSVGLPPDLATNPGVTAVPDVSGERAPPTVLDSNREPRYMSLQEAMAIALERGTRGNDSAFLLNSGNFGQINSGFSYSDDLVRSTGRGVGGDDAIRAFALDPAIAAADIEGALSKFDARLTSSMSWQKRDQAVANVFNNFNNGDFAAFSAGLIKPLPTGGVANITFETNYSRLGAVPQGFAVINPSYTPSLTVGIEQPLLRDYGVDINQLLPQHPGSTQLNTYRPSGGRAEGILVTRLRADQAKAEFERNVNALVFNVEITYWTLYRQYYNKYAAEQALRQAYVTWEQLLELERAGLQTKQGVAQARAQFEEFRVAYLQNLQNVLDAERRLRGTLGLPLEDGQRIVPADVPILAPYRPDWNTCLAEALANRPELRMARQELKVQQLSVMLQENNVRPDLRAFANYNINGIGTRLDGPGPVSQLDPNTGQITDVPGNATGSLADNKFANWQIGVRFDYPFGYRDAHANLRVAQLNLARGHVVLKNQEYKAKLFLGSIYQQLAAFHEQIQIYQARRIALGIQLQGQFERVKIGKDPLIQLLDAQRFFTQSIQQEAEAVASYNIALAAFQVAKGTILPYNSITIADGPLPAAISERAADHFAARQAGLKLRERAALTPPKGFGVPAAVPGMPVGAPLAPAEGTPTVDPNAPPPVPGEAPGPLVIPPTPPKEMPKEVLPFPPKETLPIPPKELPKDKEPKPISAPAPLPGLPAPTVSAPGPIQPAGGIGGGDGMVMPATPVSKYRPQ